MDGHPKCQEGIKPLHNKIQTLQFSQANIFADIHFLEFNPRGWLFNSRYVRIYFIWI